MCIALATLVMATSYRPKTVAEKVRCAELIVYGVAALAEQPLEETSKPVKRQCRITVLQTMWPMHQSTNKTIVVDKWVWRKWPDSWWKYYSRTGVYFFVRTSTAVKQMQEQEKRYPGITYNSKPLLKIDDTFLGTNQWIGLMPRVEDWYEPETNISVIKHLIETSKE